MESVRKVTAGRIRRLAEELTDEGIEVLRDESSAPLVLDELDYALRPPAFERRVPTYGALVLPKIAPAEWERPTALHVTLRSATDRADDEVRRYADGAASWAVRTHDGIVKLAVFDRAAGSERDLVVIAEATGATIVQRDHHDVVRLVGPFGVARWDGLSWHLEPPIDSWMRTATCGLGAADTATFDALLRFGVHDLGARGVGAILVYRTADGVPPAFELRLPTPPPLSIDTPTDLAPLFHVLGQVDGAAVFDATGTLRQLGVRLVPSPEAESGVEALRGTRHTAARRYSADDHHAVVIVVSEDGPVTVLRKGVLLGHSPDA